MMNHRTAAVAVALLLPLAGLSCGGGGGKPVEKESAQSQRLLPAGAATATGGGAVSTGAAADPAAAPMNIPQDARFTVFCTAISGPNHINQAKTLRQQLIQITGMRDWYTVQSQGQTTLYYGFYREVNEQIDPKEGTRAQNDRRRIAALTSTNGDRLFRSVLLVALEEADPSAPPDWNLENAKGFYSVQIAVYKDHARRKQYAVDAVREARAAGYEAYFYHGPTASSVCIGVWPETAVKSEGEVRSTNPNEVPLIVPGSVPVKEGIMTPDGRPIRVVRPKTEVMDQSLAATMRAFPTHSVNGVDGHQVKDPRTGQVHLVREPSLLVRVPPPKTMMAGPVQQGGGGLDAAPGGNGVVGTPATAQQGAGDEGQLRTVLPGRTQQGGRLKSLD